MQPECECPLCGGVIDKDLIAILPERGMVVAGGLFAVLTATETSLLTRLAEVFPRILSKDDAMTWMYQLRAGGDEPEIKIVDVLICKIRKKIEPLGVRVDTVWGKGYALAVSRKPQIISEVAA